MKPSTEQDYRERIVRALLYIQQHLDDDLDLDRLAAVAAFSRFHFHRIFRGLVGETLGEYVRRLRLERAAGRLKRLDDPITEIALEAGFETHESFTRAFGEVFGASPSAYRAGYRPPDYGPLPPVQLIELASTPVIFLRHVGPYDQVGATWSKLMAWAGSRGLFGPGIKLIGISHDDPDVTPPERVRYDAALAVSRPVEPEGDVGVVELAGGPYAVITHKGPYPELAKTYQLLYGGWLPQSGRELRDAPAFEHYLNSPMETRPENLRTAIHVPVV